MKEKIEKVIKEKISPILNEHMGGAVLSDFADGTAYIKFTGSCRGCYAAEDTLENVVKPILMQEVDGVEHVYLDTSVSEDLLEFAKDLLKKEKV